MQNACNCAIFGVDVNCPTNKDTTSKHYLIKVLSNNTTTLGGMFNECTGNRTWHNWKHVLKILGSTGPNDHELHSIQQSLNYMDITWYCKIWAWDMGVSWNMSPPFTNQIQIMHLKNIVITRYNKIRVSVDTSNPITSDFLDIGQDC